MGWYNDKNWPRWISARSERLFEIKFKPFRSTKAYTKLQGRPLIGYTVDFSTSEAIASARTKIKSMGIEPTEGAILITRNDAL